MTNTVLICILSVTAAFGAIGASVGLNALIKSNAEKARLRHAAGAAGGQIYINTDDVLHSGIVIAVACGMISTLAFTSVNMLMLKSMQALEERTRRLRALLVLGSTVWLFTAQAAFTIFVTTRHAKVTLFVGGLQLPDKVVAEKAKLLGSTSVYKDISYLRLVAILPWCTVLFGLLSTVSLLAFAQSWYSHDSYPPSASPAVMNEKVHVCEPGRDRPRV